jgi:hypothetical protein
MADFISDGSDPSPGRASHRAAPSPGEAQPAEGAPRHREEGEEGSRETLGPDGFPVLENQSAEQSDSSDGLITNRPPSKTNSGGEDWFEVSLYLAHRDFDGLSKRLNAAREAAEEGREGKDVVSFEGVQFLVRPSGASAGTAHKRIHFRWQLQCENGLLIQLMNREHPHRTMPNGNLRITSVLLMQFGAEFMWRHALALLEAMGCHVVRNKLSRVDPCVDIAGMKITAITDPYVAGHYVTRARASSTFEYEDHVVQSCSAVYSFGRAPTGFVVGQGSLKVRVYDKCRESNLVPEKIAAVVAYRWGYWTANASRVEFQVRRETLKDFGIDTVADWFAKRAAVCEYLCADWFRLTSGPVDRSHADRSDTLPEWLVVQQAFADWTGKPVCVHLEPLPPEEFLAINLLQQAIGLLVSYFARTGRRPNSNSEFLDAAVKKFTQLTDARNLAAEVYRKALELGLVPTAFKEFESPS